MVVLLAWPHIKDNQGLSYGLSVTPHPHAERQVTSIHSNINPRNNNRKIPKGTYLLMQNHQVEDIRKAHTGACRHALNTRKYFHKAKAWGIEAGQEHTPQVRRCKEGPCSPAPLRVSQPHTRKVWLTAC